MHQEAQTPEPLFVNLSRSPGIDFPHDGPIRQPYLMNQPARLQGWQNRFLGIDYCAPPTFTNSGSGVTTIILLKKEEFHSEKNVKL
jgi:hypothetical protein